MRVVLPEVLVLCYAVLHCTLLDCIALQLLGVYLCIALHCIIVIPEVLVARLERNTRRTAQCPLPSGPWSAAVGDLPRCYMGGHSSCVFTCETIQHGPLPLARRASCDLSACSQNLSLAQLGGRLRFVCAGGHPCPERAGFET